MNSKELDFIIYRFLGGVIYHPLFAKELDDLLSHDLRGKEEQFFKVLLIQTGYVKEFGPDIIKIDGHEKLKYIDGDFYSLHIRAKQFNVRILFSFIDHSPVFLSIFYERSKKGKTDYSSFVSTLMNRYSEMVEG